MNEEQIAGTIDRFLFQNIDNNYLVFILIVDNTNAAITATGIMPSVSPGHEVKLQGNWVTHPKFGKQFVVQHCITIVPKTVTGLKKFLGSGMIKGIGKIYAEKLVDHFKENVLTIIDTSPDRLQEVPGIGKKRIEQIITAWQEHKNIAEIMVFLQDKGISPAYAAKIYKHYKSQAIDVVKENPYRLADEVWGIGFKLADTIAQTMGFAPDSIKRITAGIIFAIKQTSTQGNLYIEFDALKTNVLTLLSLDLATHNELLKQAFIELNQADKIKLITHENQHFVTLTSFYFCERAVAEKIKQITNHKAQKNFDIDTIYRTFLQAAKNIELSQQQQKGIISSLQHKITVITGGPGTGKTTLIKELLNILEHEQVTFKLAAPTGRAAKRITEGTGRYATTIHRI